MTMCMMPMGQSPRLFPFPPDQQTPDKLGNTLSDHFRRRTDYAAFAAIRASVQVTKSEKIVITADMGLVRIHPAHCCYRPLLLPTLNHGILLTPIYFFLFPVSQTFVTPELLYGPELVGGKLVNGQPIPILKPNGTGHGGKIAGVWVHDLRVPIPEGKQKDEIEVALKQSCFNIKYKRGEEWVKSEFSDDVRPFNRQSKCSPSLFLSYCFSLLARVA